MKYIGKDFEKNDAWAKVTGSAQYLADIQLPRTLHAQVLRPPHAHARITSVSVDAAMACPGVVRVVTGRDCDIRFGACGFRDQHPMARDKIRHAGEAVAVVIADTVKNAKRALKKIAVEYEVMETLLDPIDSARNRSVLIHEDLGDYFHFDCYYPEPGTNIFHHYKLRKGDIETGMEAADVTVQADFDMPLSAHSALEPHGVICRWQGTDRVEIWSSSQAPFVLQGVIADMFGLPHANVRVYVPYLGGGFGGKSDVTIEPLIAYAARAIPGRPVRYVCSRKEVITSTVLGRGMRGRAILGATKDGKFTGFRAELYFAGGAYGDTTTNIVTVAGHNSVGPYAIDNCHVDAFGVYTNSPPVGAFRGYGHPEGCLMSERLVDMMARKLSMSPLELRRKNFLRKGTTNSLGESIYDYNGNLFTCMGHVAEHLFSTPKPEEDDTYLYGRGVAAMMKSPKGAPNAGSGCQMKFCEDGSVLLNLSGIDMGQGAQQAMRQIAAEALMIPVERIRSYESVDTQHSPWEWQTVASMFTWRGGNAVIKTAKKAIKILKKNAALALGADVDSLEYDGESVFLKTDPQLKKDVSQLVRGYMHEGGLTVGEVADVTAADRLPRYVEPDAKTGMSTGMGNAGGTWTFGCQGCELKIEKKTGRVIIDKFVSSFDVGRVISPRMIRGQIVGGVVMGIGQTLKEKIEFSEDGNITNANWKKYRMPVLSEMPGEQVVVCVETPDARGPFGARCIAEHPMVAVAPTILNAIQDATGHDFCDVPVTPEKILELLNNER